MERFVIKEIKEHNVYVLQNADNLNELELMLEFYGIEPVLVNSQILIHEELLNKNSKNFVQPYAFEFDTSINVDNIMALNDPEFAALSIDNNIYTLKRIYG